MLVEPRAPDQLRDSRGQVSQTIPAPAHVYE